MDWLKAFCNPDGPDYLAAPHVVGDYTIATDGRHALLLRGRHGANVSERGLRLMGKAIESILATEATSPVRLQELGTFCGEADVDVECDQCRGIGHVKCDLRFEHACPQCDGKGKLRLGDLRPVQVQGVMVDGNRLAVALEQIIGHLPHENVTMGRWATEDSSYLVLAGETWRYALACVSSVDKNRYADVPVFGTTEKATV